MNAIKNMELKIEEISVDEIFEHPEVPNIRAKITKIDIKELIESIKVSGIQNPLSCFRVKDDPKIYLESGFRRLEACKELKIKTVPVIFKLYDDPVKQALFGNFVENAQRQDVNGYDMAARLQKLLDMGMKKDEIGESLGKSITWIETTLKFLKSDPAVQELVKKGSLTLDEGRKIAKLPEEVQEEAAEKLAEAKEIGDTDAKKKIKKAVKEAGRVNTHEGASKKDIKVLKKKIAVVLKAMENSGKVKLVEKPSEQDYYILLKGSFNVIKWVLGELKNTMIDSKAAEYNIKFDKNGEVALIKEEDKPEKSEKPDKTDKTDKKTKKSEKNGDK